MCGRTRGNVIRWRWQTLNSICKGCGTRIRSFRPSFSWWLSSASNWNWCCVAPKVENLTLVLVGLDGQRQ